MGISGFYGRWIKRSMGRALRRQIPGGLSSLSVDMNGVIHEVLARVYGYVQVDPRGRPAEKAATAAANEKAKAVLAQMTPDEQRAYYFAQLGQELVNIVKVINPHDAVFFAVDGVAPGSKIQQQRQRRYRVSPVSHITNAVTPGTDFMFALDAYLRQWIEDFRLHLPPTVMYSSHLVPGEGEHKIMDLYRSGKLRPSLGAASGHLLLGRDADLIVLGLVAPLDTIYVMHDIREDRGGLNIVDIAALREDIFARAGNRPSALHDFVVLSALNGNDFLPHVPAFSPHHMQQNFDLLLDVYAERPYALVRVEPWAKKPGATPAPAEIDWEQLACFLTHVSQFEQWGLNAQAADAREYAHPSRFVEAALPGGKGAEVSLAAFRDAWYENAFADGSDLKGAAPPKSPAMAALRGSKSAGPIPPIDFAAEVGHMCLNFLTGLAWFHRYYVAGPSQVNPGWIYHYHHAPLLQDLAAVARAAAASPDLPALVRSFRPGPSDIRFGAVHQLLAVLPPASAALLPPQVLALLEPGSLIADVFPRAFVVEAEGTNKDHEAISRVPFVSRQRVARAVESVAGDGVWLRRWDDAKPLVSTLSPKQAELFLYQARALDKRSRNWNAKIEGRRRVPVYRASGITIGGRALESPDKPAGGPLATSLAGSPRRSAGPVKMSAALTVAPVDVEAADGLSLPTYDPLPLPEVRPGSVSLPPVSAAALDAPPDEWKAVLPPEGFPPIARWRRLYRALKHPEL